MIKIQVKLKNGDTIHADSSSSMESFLQVFQAQSIQGNKFFAFESFVVEFDSIHSIILNHSIV